MWLDAFTGLTGRCHSWDPICQMREHRRKILLINIVTIHGLFQKQSVPFHIQALVYTCDWSGITLTHTRESIPALPPREISQFCSLDSKPLIAAASSRLQIIISEHLVRNVSIVPLSFFFLCCLLPSLRLWGIHYHQLMLYYAGFNHTFSLSESSPSTDKTNCTKIDV